MMDELKRLLEHLETTLDADQQSAIHDLHRRALRWERIERLPLILQYPLPDNAPFKRFPYRHAFHAPEKMLFNELIGGFDTSICYHRRVGDDLPFSIRANCGTVIVASMFGAAVEVIEDNPPWVRPFESLDSLMTVFDVDPLDFTRGLCPKIVGLYQYYREVFENYPNVRQCVKVVLPDLEGPFDNAELLRGSAIYLDLVEDEDFVRRLLERMVQAQVGFARHLKPLITDDLPGFCHQHSAVVPGAILIREDSPINMSAEMYRRIVAPYDKSVLSQLGGGSIHFCGKGDHLVAELLRLPSLMGIDLGQPEMNDLDAIYAQARARKIPLPRICVSEDDLRSGRARERFPTGVTVMQAVPSMERARELMDAHRAVTD